MPAGILIIEDECRLARNIQVYLERSGFLVRKAVNGLDGLNEFRRFAPDAVLLNLGLPDLNGIEVLQRLLDLDARIKVIVMTGAGLGTACEAAIRAGAWNCISKPLVLRDLQRLLEHATGE